MIRYIEVKPLGIENNFLIFYCFLRIVKFSKNVEVVEKNWRQIQWPKYIDNDHSHELCISKNISETQWWLNLPGTVDYSLQNEWIADSYQLQVTLGGWRLSTTPSLSGYLIRHASVITSKFYVIMIYRVFLITQFRIPASQCDQ